MSVEARYQDNKFIAGGGEMGVLIRKHNWAATSLGTPDQWPQSLRTTLSIILNSKFPMFLFWGNELLCFYNDAYRPSLGNDGKHPYALGKPAGEIWPEIWHIIKPLIDQVLSTGEATWSEDQLIPIYRNGTIEDVYWTFSYSPVKDESELIAGVFITCTETTEKVINLHKLEENKDELEFAIDAAKLGTFDYNPATRKFSANNRLKEWFGIPDKAEIDLNDAVNAITEKDRQRVMDAITTALSYSSGGSYNIEYTILNHHTGKETIVVAKGRAWFDENKTAYRFNGTLEDITGEALAQKELEERRQQLELAIQIGDLGAFKIDLSTDTITYSPHIAGWFGFSTSSLHRDEILTSVYPDDVTLVNETLINSIAGEAQGKHDFIYRIVNPHTMQLRHVRSIGQVLYEHDMPIAISGILQDITTQVLAQKQLEESERMLRFIILQAPVAISIFRSKNYVVEIVNERALEMWGRTEKEVMGQPILSAMPELTTQGIQMLLDDVYDTGISFVASELPVQLMRNGHMETAYINFVYDPLYNSNGEVDGIMTVGIEVTDQVLARRKIEESEQRVRTLIKHAPFPIGVYVGKEMRIDIANQSILDVWGKGNDVIGKLYAEILPELENQDIYAQLDGVYTTGTPLHVHNRRLDIVMNDEIKPFYFSYSFTPLFDVAGNIYGVMNTAADVTALNVAKKKVEDVAEELSRTTNRLQQALEAGKLGSYELDFATGSITCTTQCKQNLGLPDDAVLNFELLQNSILPEDKKTMLDAVENSIAHHTVYDAEYRVMWPDASIHWVHATGQPVYNANGEAIKMTGVTADITKQKLFEQELAKQVQERTRELEQKNAELEKMNTELQSFAYVSSHDLQEPLRKIQTFAELVAKRELNNLSATGKDYFNRMQQAANRMQTLIKDLLAYSRTNSANYVFEPTDINEVVKEVEEELKHIIQSTHATINAHGLCTIYAIPFQMRQLFHNLISNSLKFSVPGRKPVITIESHIVHSSKVPHARRQDKHNYCHIIFSDNGIGFAPEYSEKIFEVFQRLHTDNQYQGTGIGLAIVNKIVENHNGIITATGQPGNGARFDIYIQNLSPALSEGEGGVA